MAELEDDSVDFGLDLEAAQRWANVVELLRKLHIAADEPSRRDLQRWAARNGKPLLAPATQSELLAGQRRPKREVVLAFIEGCGVRGARLGEWQRMLVRVALAEHDRPTFTEELEEQRRRAQAEADQVLQQARDEAAGIVAAAEELEERRRQILAETQAEVEQIILRRSIRETAEHLRGLEEQRPHTSTAQEPSAQEREKTPGLGGPLAQLLAMARFYFPDIPPTQGFVRWVDSEDGSSGVELHASEEVFLFLPAHRLPIRTSYELLPLKEVVLRCPATVRRIHINAALDNALVLPMDDLEQALLTTAEHADKHARGTLPSPAFLEKQTQTGDLLLVTHTSEPLAYAPFQAALSCKVCGTPHSVSDPMCLTCGLNLRR